MLKNMCVYEPKQGLGRQDALADKAEITIRYVDWVIAGKGGGSVLPFSFDKDEDNMSDFLTDEDVIAVEAAPLLVVSGQLRPVYHQGEGVMATGQIPVGENESMVVEPVEVYAFKALKALRWHVENVQAQAVDSFENIDLACMKTKHWQWEFTTQTQEMPATRTDAYLSDLPHYVETMSDLAPIYAWGGRYQQGIALEQIAALYMGLKGDVQDRSLQVEFLDEVPHDKYNLVGADHPCMYVEGKKLHAMNLKEIIERGGVQLKVALDGGEDEETVYRSCRVESYSAKEGWLRIVFRPMVLS